MCPDTIETINTEEISEQNMPQSMVVGLTSCAEKALRQRNK